MCDSCWAVAGHDVEDPSAWITLTMHDPADAGVASTHPLGRPRHVCSLDCLAAYTERLRRLAGGLNSLKDPAVQAPERTLAGGRGPNDELAPAAQPLAELPAAEGPPALVAVPGGKLDEPQAEAEQTNPVDPSETTPDLPEPRGPRLSELLADADPDAVDLRAVADRSSGRARRWGRTS